MGLRGRRLLLAIGAALAMSSLWASSAQAFQTHTFTSSFGAPSYAYGMAVDNSASVSSGDLYQVIPPGAPPEVIKYDSEGHELSKIDNTSFGACLGARNFNNPFGVAVNPTNGDVYVSDLSIGTVSAFGPTGTCLFQTHTTGGSAGGIAIDPSRGPNGTLYVSANNNRTIESFDAASGSPISSFGSGPGYILSLAVNSSGQIFVDTFNEKVVEYESNGECVNECEPFDSNGSQTVTIDPANNHILVFGNNQISDYAPGASFPGITFGQGYICCGLSFGAAVNATSNRFYISDFYAFTVEVFDQGPNLPGATTEGVINPGTTSGRLTGHLDPEGGGEVTACHFEYGTDASYSLGSLPCEPAPPYAAPTGVHADLSGLTAETTYHYRLTVSNAGGSNSGQDRTYTPHAVIGLATEPATNVARTAAQLNGSFVGNGEDTHYYFEYGTDQSYGHTTAAPPGVDAGSGSGPTPAAANLSELTPQTVYHYRVVAANGSGTSYGEDQRFRTPPAVAKVLTEVATNVTRNSATINGSFSGNGEDTHYYFEWGPNTGYGNTEPVPPGVDAGSGAGPHPASVNLSGLLPGTEYHYRFVATNAVGTTYGEDLQFAAVPAVEKVETRAASGITRTAAQLNGAFVGNGEDTHYYFEWGPNTGYGNTEPVPPGVDAGSGAGTTPVSANLSELTPQTEYHYRLVAVNAVGTTFGDDHSLITLSAVPGLKSEAATNVMPRSAQLNGSFVGNGEDTHYYFEWGTDPSYGHTTTAPPGVDAGSGVGPTPVSFELGGINPITTYYFRLVASNAVGTTYGLEESFTTPPDAPLVSESVTDVHSESATVHAQINPGGGDTKYHFEYATQQEYEASGTYGFSAPIPDRDVGSGQTDVPVAEILRNLTPGTIYHWRVVASNTTGTTYGPDRSLTTFPFVPVLEDSCANVHARQQTGAAQLLDCRAYELVSAANTAGYDVESDLVPGQTPYPSYPNAEAPSRVLYAVHDGGIPGTNNPTNRAADPYVATRNAETGWSTEYDGVPANNPFSAAPFSSIPSGASANLETLAFGGPEGCSPCFAGGYTGIPVHLPDGSLVQGMVAAPGLEPGPAATSDGKIAKDLSANGEHFIFGSTSLFAEGGNDATGDVSIYDHNLKTGATHVVSNTSSTEDFPVALPCLQGKGSCHSPGDGNGISELDISSDGSHILLGQKVATDADGNVYWHLYMDVNDGIASVDLTPATTSGVLYDGMSADGSAIFFTTKDALTADDHDTSADIYKASLSGSTATLTRISTGSGGAGDTNACDPVSNSNGEHWNSVGSAKNCNALAIGGGGGIGTTDGSIYFLSPEQLDGAGKGTQDQPNLYLAAPGQPPHFIATLDPEDPVVVDSLKAVEQVRTADFEVSPSGRYAALVTKKPLSNNEDSGFFEVYRYDATTESLDCVSCNPTKAEATGSAAMAGAGLSLTADGRVFFNSNDALVLSDADHRQDVYEWEPLGTGNCQPQSPAFFELSAACVSLISSGSGQFASSLLGVGSSGIDAYFFTRAAMTPHVENGPLMKIYDARELGGFPYVPPKPECKASDECHGAGTPVPPPPTIDSKAGSGGNLVSEAPRHCKAGFVRKHGRCVRKRRGSKHHQRGGRR